MGPGVHLPERVGAGTGASGSSAPHNLPHSAATSPPHENGIAAALTHFQEENLGFKSLKLIILKPRTIWVLSRKLGGPASLLDKCGHVQGQAHRLLLRVLWCLGVLEEGSLGARDR